MNRSRIGVSIALLAVVGGGAFLLVRYFNKSPGTTNALVPGTAQTRKAVVEVPALKFTDVTEKSGIHFRHFSGATPQKLLPETMAGGVAIFDYDGDGKPDILFTNGRPWPGQPMPAEGAPTMKLYRNKGNFEFEDVTERVGLNVTMYGMGVAVGDFDNDGRPDVFVSCIGKHHLFRNVDGKRFEDVTDAAGIGGPGPDLPAVGKDEFFKWKDPTPFGSSCTFLDYDGDGRLDLFVCHYVTWSPAIDLSVNSTLTGGGRTYQQPQQLEGSQCRLYRNVDGKRFEDVTAEAGVLVTSKEGTDANARVRAVGKSLGVIVCDPDGDGWPDILVANDTVRNFLFHNEAGPDGKRVYKEIGVQAGAAYADEGRPRGGMGIDWGEFAPGRSACVVANFANEPLTFLEKSPGAGLLFSDNAQGVGLIAATRLPLKFGTFYFDADNDGRLDLLVNNGHIDPDIGRIQEKQQYAQAPQLYWNTGDSDCYFEPVPAEKSGPDLVRPIVGRGSAFADLDGDGYPDVILVGNGGPARVLRNDAPKDNHWVRLDLRGDGKTANRSAVGATVTVEAGGQTYRRTVTGGRGYLSQSELVLTIGLGPATKVDRVTVRWPGRDVGTEVWSGLAADKAHTLERGKAR